jgi:hypothetical protein
MTGAVVAVAENDIIETSSNQRNRRLSAASKAYGRLVRVGANGGVIVGRKKEIQRSAKIASRETVSVIKLTPWLDQLMNW